MMTLSPEDIARRLQRAAPTIHEPNTFRFGSRPERTAAVLIPLVQHNGAWHVVFIRRANMPGDLHSGQVSFPGGGTHPTDGSPTDTALRESWEEIGLNPQDVQVLGQLGQIGTISNYRVTPVVGWLPRYPYPFRLQTGEVARVFTIPYDFLAQPGIYEERQRALPTNGTTLKAIYFREYDNETLWGASARMMLELIRLLEA
ncbi:MAG: CoA pyrophosphatase [Anaerolineales bacterium]